MAHHYRDDWEWTTDGLRRAEERLDLTSEAGLAASRGVLVEDSGGDGAVDSALRLAERLLCGLGVACLGGFESLTCDRLHLGAGRDVADTCLFVLTIALDL